MSTPEVPGSCSRSPASREQEMEGVLWTSSTGRRHPPPHPPSHGEGGTSGGGRAATEPSAVRAAALPQCLFTNPALRARKTRLLFQARCSRCQPGRRGCLEPWTPGGPQNRPSAQSARPARPLSALLPVSPFLPSLQSH